MKLQDLIAELRVLDAERLALDARSREIKKKQDEKTALAINLMTEQQLEIVDGAYLEEVQKPYISDYHALEEYIKENEALDLLQKRLTETAVRLRWDEGIQIPGIGLSSELKLRLK